MNFKFLSILSVSIILLVMQNCGEFHSMKDGDFSSSLLDSSDLSGEDQRTPFQMLSKTQLLSSVVTATGVTQADSTLVKTSRSLSPILSEKSDLGKYNPPRAMTYANIAGDACRQLIAQEKSEKNKRLIRYGLPVNANDITDQEIEETVRSFARSFWSRNETPDELQIIKDGLKAFENVREVASLKEQARAERQTLYLCTAMLSSLDAITY